MVIIGSRPSVTTDSAFSSVNKDKVAPVLFTARKRSLGQGNIFTPVCHSVHRGRGLAWFLGGDVHGCSRGGMCGCCRGACVVAPGGMHGCSGGVCGCSGACVVALGGMHGCSRGACVGYDEILRYDQ